MATAIRPAVKWHGGKHYLAARIVALMPEHSTYVEPFGGAASVLLNKPPAAVEVYNDLDLRLVNFFRVLRNHCDDLMTALVLTPYAEAEYAQSTQADDKDLGPVEQARRFFVACRQSIGGRGDAWSYTLHRVRRGMADVVSGYLSAIDDELPKIVERLRQVQILNRPATEVIAKWDSPTTLFYCDPPYVHGTRVATDAYGHEMTDADHRELAEMLHAIKGKAMLSGYQCPLYDELYSGWRRVTFDLPNNSAGGKTKARKEECVWMNF